MKHLCVQYGCGWSSADGWLNFDSSPTLRYERLPVLGRLYQKNARRFPENVRYGDIVRGLPIAPGSCAAIYCSHVLEHLSFAEFGTALQNTHSYLEPGGVFRLVLPDLEQLARAYLADPASDAAARFMQDSGLGKRDRPRGLRGHLVEWFGNSHHRWMWDERSMREQLAAAGFREIRRAQFGDAEDRRFDAVEDPTRFEGCLAMQCRR